MDPKLAAARMTAHPINYGEVPGGTPGLGLTGLDVAAALSMGGATKEASAFIEVKWADNDVSERQLVDLMLKRVERLAKKNRWRVCSGPDTLRRLTLTAIREVIAPGLCPTCRGHEEVWFKGMRVAKVCPTCNGVGRRGMTDNWRARSMGITPSAFHQTWKSLRYPAVLSLVQGIEASGLVAMRRGIG